MSTSPLSNTLFNFTCTSSHLKITSAPKQNNRPKRAELPELWLQEPKLKLDEHNNVTLGNNPAHPHTLPFSEHMRPLLTVTPVSLRDTMYCRFLSHCSPPRIYFDILGYFGSYARSVNLMRSCLESLLLLMIFFFSLSLPLSLI